MAARDSALNDNSLASFHQGIDSPDQERPNPLPSSLARNVPIVITPMPGPESDRIGGVEGSLVHGAPTPASRPRSLYKVPGAREGVPQVLLSDEHAAHWARQKTSDRPRRQSASPATLHDDQGSDVWVASDHPGTNMASYSTADTRTGDRIISGAPDLRAYNLDLHASNDSRFFVRTPLTPIGGPAGRLREYWTDSLATGPQDDAGSCGAGNPSPGIVTDQEPPRERNIPRPRPAVWWFIKLIEDSVH